MVSFGISPQRYNRGELLSWDVAEVNRFLASFEPCPNGPRRAVVAAGELVFVQNFPLPDVYRPDQIDLTIVMSNYPDRPPYGLHVLCTDRNRAAIDQIRSRFGHVFGASPYPEAAKLPGHEWVCFKSVYRGQAFSWGYNLKNPARGDTLAKYLERFFEELS